MPAPATASPLLLDRLVKVEEGRHRNPRSAVLAVDYGQVAPTDPALQRCMAHSQKAGCDALRDRFPELLLELRTNGSEISIPRDPSLSASKTSDALETT
jgi:hypothetical protein